MSAIFARNRALDINPPAGDSHLSTGGSDWLWAVMACFTLFFLIYYALSFKAFNGERVFHYLFTIGLFTGMVAYFAMASDLAFSVVRTSLYRSTDATYQMFWAKYVYWVVAWPVILIALGLISGVSWASIVFNVFLSWAWVLSYLAGAYTASNYRWGFWAFGTTAWLILAVQTLWHGRTSAARVNVLRDYSILSGWLNLLWILYPIAWAISDGGNVISVTKNTVYFGVLDLLMLPIIAFGFLVMARKWDYGALNLHFTQYGRVGARDGVFPEKSAAAPGTTAPAAVPAEGVVTA
ncbi:hypothetical protein BGZ63DRAFT_407309 [Mariannaea sp. PMI_226]|nr:hypothetical protein BGZ63DRAFT_407309 [Mariannaea sp. PMI_226]